MLAPPRAGAGAARPAQIMKGDVMRAALEAFVIAAFIIALLMVADIIQGWF